MLKKIAISIMGIILIASIALAAYKTFEPNTNSKDEAVSSIYITLNTLEEYTLSTGDNTYHYYFFCSPQDNNCIYVYNTVFTSVKNLNNGVSLDSIIEYVDITNILNNDSLHKELQKYNINTYPALVSLKVENGKIVINNVLEYDKNNPLNSTDVINWLKENNIYSGN